MQTLSALDIIWGGFGEFNRYTFSVTLQTGLLTSIFASLDAILFLAIPDTAYNFALDFPLSKLYTNSLLSSLNARGEYRNELRGFLSLGDTTGSESLEFRHVSTQQVLPLNTVQRSRQERNDPLGADFRVDRSRVSEPWRPF
ncbi:hypothetical protein AB1N83_014126 [Pleurotus pulmonarius]